MVVPITRGGTPITSSPKALASLDFACPSGENFGWSAGLMVSVVGRNFGWSVALVGKETFVWWAAMMASVVGRTMG